MNTPDKPSKSNTGWLLLVVLVLGWVGAMYLLNPGKGSLSAPDLSKRQGFSVAAPPSWKLADLDGKPVDFGDFRGKAVFVNLWATWCPPCREEMPGINNLASNERLKDVVFLAVALDEDPHDVRNYLAKNRVVPRVLIPLEKPPEMFASDGIPATFIVAPDGRIEVGQVGSASWDAPEVVALLERLSRTAAKK